MKPLATFIFEWEGKPLDRDHVYGAQCMDIVEEYVAECLGLPPLTGNAVDVWRHGPRHGYDLVPNAPNNYPAPGDIVVWGGPSHMVGTGIFGHIAVAVLADEMHLYTFDQNWPEGSGCHLQLHSYTAVLGWLHPHPA